MRIHRLLFFAVLFFSQAILPMFASTIRSTAARVNPAVSYLSQLSHRLLLKNLMRSSKLSLITSPIQLLTTINSNRANYSTLSKLQFVSKSLSSVKVKSPLFKLSKRFM